MNMKLELLNKDYDGESICDVSRDVSEAFLPEFTENAGKIPVDEYGFSLGKFTVLITWEPNKRT